MKYVKFNNKFIPLVVINQICIGTDHRTGSTRVTLKCKFQNDDFDIIEHFDSFDKVTNTLKILLQNIKHEIIVTNGLSEFDDIILQSLNL